MGERIFTVLFLQAVLPQKRSVKCTKFEKICIGRRFMQKKSRLVQNGDGFFREGAEMWFVERILDLSSRLFLALGIVNLLVVIWVVLTNAPVAGNEGIIPGLKAAFGGCLLGIILLGLAKGARNRQAESSS